MLGKKANTTIRLALVFLLNSYSLNIAAAMDTLVISSSTIYTETGKYLSVLEDQYGVVNIHDLLKKENKYSFRKIKDDVPAYSDNESYVWVKLNILNNTEKTILLDISNVLLDSVYFFETIDSRIISTRVSGNKVPFSNRKIRSNKILFDLTETPGTKTIYLRFKISMTRQFPIYISTYDDFLEKQNTEFFFNGLFYGLITALGIFSLIFALSESDKSYFFYVLYLLFSELLLLHLDGITYAFFWPTKPQINDYISIIVSVPIFVASLFTINFLDLKQNSERLIKGLWIMIIVLAAICLISLSEISFLKSATRNLFIGLIAFYYFINIGIVVYRKGFGPAKYYTLGWSFLLIGCLLYVFKNLNWAPYTFITVNSLKIGSASAAALMTFAIIERINFYRNEKEKLEAKRLYMENQLENSKSQLLSYTENLKKRNIFIEEVQRKLSELELKVKESEFQQNQTEDIEKLINSTILTDQNWAEFKKLFNKVHPGFINRIRERSNLTETDIRILTLLKLEQNNAEMAEMLGVSIEAVRKAKQRLQKKLFLQHKESLVEIISKF